eukprot:gene4987-12066_t
MQYDIKCDWMQETKAVEKRRDAWGAAQSGDGSKSVEERRTEAADELDSVRADATPQKDNGTITSPKDEAGTANSRKVDIALGPAWGASRRMPDVQPEKNDGCDPVLGAAWCGRREDTDARLIAELTKDGGYGEPALGFAWGGNKKMLDTHTTNRRAARCDDRHGPPALGTAWDWKASRRWCDAKKELHTWSANEQEKKDGYSGTTLGFAWGKRGNALALLLQAEDEPDSGGGKNALGSAWGTRSPEEAHSTTRECERLAAMARWVALCVGGIYWYLTIKAIQSALHALLGNTSPTPAEREKRLVGVLTQCACRRPQYVYGRLVHAAAEEMSRIAKHQPEAGRGALLATLAARHGIEMEIGGVPSEAAVGGTRGGGKGGRGGRGAKGRGVNARGGGAVGAERQPVFLSDRELTDDSVRVLSFDELYPPEATGVALCTADQAMHAIQDLRDRQGPLAIITTQPMEGERGQSQQLDIPLRRNDGSLAKVAKRYLTQLGDRPAIVKLRVQAEGMDEDPLGTGVREISVHLVDSLCGARFPKEERWREDALREARSWLQTRPQSSEADVLEVHTPKEISSVEGNRVIQVMAQVRSAVWAPTVKASGEDGIIANPVARGDRAQRPPVVWLPGADLANVRRRCKASPNTLGVARRPDGTLGVRAEDARGIDQLRRTLLGQAEAERRSRVFWDVVGLPRSAVDRAEANAALAETGWPAQMERTVPKGDTRVWVVSTPPNVAPPQGELLRLRGRVYQVRPALPRPTQGGRGAAARGSSPPPTAAWSAAPWAGRTSLPEAAAGVEAYAGWQEAARRWQGAGGGGQLAGAPSLAAHQPKQVQRSGGPTMRWGQDDSGGDDDDDPNEYWGERQEEDGEGMAEDGWEGAECGAGEEAQWREAEKRWAEGGEGAGSGGAGADGAVRAAEAARGEPRPAAAAAAQPTGRGAGVAVGGHLPPARGGTTGAGGAARAGGASAFRQPALGDAEEQPTSIDEKIEAGMQRLRVSMFEDLSQLLRANIQQAMETATQQIVLRLAAPPPAAALLPPPPPERGGGGDDVGGGRGDGAPIKAERRPEVPPPPPRRRSRQRRWRKDRERRQRRRRRRAGKGSEMRTTQQWLGYTSNKTMKKRRRGRQGTVRGSGMTERARSALRKKGGARERKRDEEEDNQGQE